VNVQPRRLYIRGLGLKDKRAAAFGAQGWIGESVVLFLSVAKVEIRTFDDVKVLVAERFDRR
jgi:flavorubredoxin